MKRMIVTLIFIFAGVTLFSSCKTKQKCAAYGSYSYIENQAPEQNQL